MKAMNTLTSVLLVATLGSLAGAQDAGATKKQESGQTKEAAAKPETGRELAFTVTGLTKDNVAKTKETLQALEMKVYTCAACQVEQHTAGTCPKCKGPLEAESHAILSKVEPSAEKSSLALTIEPGASLRLSELESALGKNAVRIEPAQVLLQGRSRLVVQGATADAIPTIEKALTDAKLFDEVKATYDAAKSEFFVMVRAGTAAPTRAKVATALESAKAKLSDVVWVAVPAKS